MPRKKSSVVQRRYVADTRRCAKCERWRHVFCFPASVVAHGPKGGRFYAKARTCKDCSQKWVLQ